MPSLTGSCICNAVSLTIKDADPVLKEGLEICHCTDCRQFTGVARGADFLEVSKTNVEIKGEDGVKEFVKKSDAGNTYTRRWCGACGGRLWDTTTLDGKEGTIYIHAGIFPPGSLPEPSVHIWTRSAEKWDKPADGVFSLEQQ